MLRTEAALVSVVIPTRNRPAQLFEAIESALQQDWPAVEVIVVDDASTDDTPRRLRERSMADARLRVVRNDVPQGGSGARNQGVEASRGVYLAFLDDDDVWLPGKLTAQIRQLEMGDGVVGVSCGFVVKHPGGRESPVVVTASQDAQHLLRVNHLGGASMCLTTRAAFDAVGGFDPALPSSQDWDLWIKLSRLGRVAVCGDVLVVYRPHAGPRITTQLRAAYAGRRRVFLRYRPLMTSATRRCHLAELLFYRRVRFERRLTARCAGFLAAGTLAGWMGSLRFAYRLVKSA